MEPDDHNKGFTDQMWSDLKAIAEQSLAPISMIIAELRHVDLLVNIGRLFLAPALLTAIIVVFITSPLISVWNYYTAYNKKETSLENKKTGELEDSIKTPTIKREMPGSENQPKQGADTSEADLKKGQSHARKKI